MATPEACRQSNLSQMLTRTGYDVVIVCTSNETQAAYWQVRLAGGSVVPANCTVLAVDEDWEGGAGNALGTFYAYQKACAKGKETSGRPVVHPAKKTVSSPSSLERRKRLHMGRTVSYTPK